MSNTKTQKPSANLALIDAANTLDTLAKDGAQLAMVADPGFSDGLKMATTIARMREALTPEVMAPIMALMNSPLGFRTDKDPSQIDRKTGKPMVPYTLEVVREATLEALLRGVPTINNSFNIIAGRCYITKEGFSFLLRHKVPGLTNLETKLGVPKMKEGGAIVDCEATWRMDGKPQSINRSFAIKVNAMMGADAISGKATRKLLAAVYAQATGTELGDGEADVEVMRDVTKRENPLAENSTNKEGAK